MDRKTVFVTVSVFFLLACPVMGASPNVTLVSPPDGYATQRDYVELSCNASDDAAISSLGLYTDIGGSFGLYQMNSYEELGSGLGHTMLCHLNGSYSCWNSAETTQTNLTGSGIAFEQGKMGFGAGISSGDSLGFATSGVISSYDGSLEFWVMPKSGISGTRYLFMLGESDSDLSNQIRLYINSSDHLVFEWYTDSMDGYMSHRYADVSWWENDTWYHVAATWENSDNMNLYINGSDALTQKPPVQEMGYVSWTPSNAYIGGKFDSSSQLDGIFDEFITFSSLISPATVLSHYRMGLGNRTGVTGSWNITNISDGSYYWDCYVADNESNSAWNGSNYTFHVDVSSPPNISSVSHVPQSEDALDPGVTINVTANITDASGVHTAILQYRRDSESSWTNVSMGNVSDQWNASFVAAAPHDTWHYRIWANDSSGFSGNSSEQVLSVDSDYTWSVDTNELGTTYAYIDADESLGVVTIYNTGDYPLSFSLSSTYPDMEYNVSNPSGFDIPSGTNRSVEINVTASSTAYEYLINITLDAISSNANPSLEEINATLITYVGGPYLSVDITEAPSSVNQSQTGVNLTGRVKNIGNETAYEVWLNFTLPSGFSVTSGNATQYVGDLAQGASQTSTVTVTVSPSGTRVGTYVIPANASCNESVNGSDSVVVGVSCNGDDDVCGLGCSYVTDSDCPTPGGGGSSGTGTTIVGGGLARTEYELVVVAPERLDIDRGENVTLTASVEYGFSFTADDVSMELSGYPLTYLSVSPPEYDGVNEGDTLTFKVDIIAPPYIRVGQYELEMELSGEGKTVNNTISGSASSVIFVHSGDNESDLFEQARKAAQAMINLGFSPEDMQEMVSQLDALMDDWDYDGAQDLANQILYTSELALGVRDMLEDIDNDVAEARSFGLSAQETEKLYGLASMAFQRGDYERAEERALNARSAFSLETFGLVPLLVLARSYWWAIALSFLLAGLAGFYMVRRAAAIRLRGKLSKLDIEEKSINSLITRLQKDHFSATKPELGTESYERALENYRNDLASIKRRRLVLMTGSGKSSLEKLSRRKDAAMRIIRDFQSRHFNRGEIGRDLYSRTMRQIREEMGDIEKEMDMLSSRKKGSCRSMVFSVFMAVALLASVSAGQYSNEEVLAKIVQAEQVIDGMSEAGFGVSYANDTLEEARTMLSRGEYTAAMALARQVWDIGDTATEADSLIDLLDEEIYSASLDGIDVSDAAELAREGAGLFEIEDYFSSREKLEEASMLIEAARSDAALRESLRASPGERLLATLSDNWHVLIAALAGIAAFSFVLRRLRKRAAMKHELSRMERERESLKRMIKSAQERYFGGRSLGKSSYDTMMEKHGNRLAQLDKDMLAMKEMLDK